MSYTNNIYIPYINNFHNEEKFLFYENYYKNLGFNVKKIFLENVEEIGYAKILDKLMSNDEEIFIFIDYLLVSPFAIKQSVEICLENKCMVIPSNKLYIIDDKDEIDSIIGLFSGEQVIESFYYDKRSGFNIWPLNGAWVIHKESLKGHTAMNSLIETPAAYDFDTCYRQYIFNKIVFVESDSYKFNPYPANINRNTLFIYKEYLNSLINVFGFPENAFLYKNQIFEKISPEKCKDLIFNVEKYFKYARYV